MTMALYIITIVIVKARGIIHIAFRVHALSNVIKMLATSVTLAWRLPAIYRLIPTRQHSRTLVTGPSASDHQRDIQRPSCGVGRKLSWERSWRKGGKEDSCRHRPKVRDVGDLWCKHSYLGIELLRFLCSLGCADFPKGKASNSGQETIPRHWWKYVGVRHVLGRCWQLDVGISSRNNRPCPYRVCPYNKHLYGVLLSHLTVTAQQCHSGSNRCGSQLDSSRTANFHRDWSPCGLLAAMTTFYVTLLIPDPTVQCPKRTVLIYHWVSTYHSCQKFMATIEPQWTPWPDATYKSTAGQTGCIACRFFSTQHVEGSIVDIRDDHRTYATCYPFWHCVWG